MTFQDLYLGQRVRILSWDELNSISHHDSAYGIYLPDNSFFNSEMKYLCGATLSTPSTIGFRRWLLSPAMLAPLNESSSVIPPAISFDQLLAGGELPQ